MKINHRITGIIVIEANILNDSPLLIGSGTDENADKEIIRSPDKTPYIPGTAFAGKFLRIFKHNQTEVAEAYAAFKQFWGGEIDYVDKGEEKTQQYQSHIIFDDALMVSDFKNITIRDGVRIDNTSSLAENQGKFDYEILEPNHTFKFRAEIKIREGFTDFDRMALFLMNNLRSFQIGANEKSGFGLMKSEDVRAYYFDFTVEKERKNWFDYLEGKFNIVGTNLTVSNPIPLRPKQGFKISADFSVKSTLLTASYSVDGKEPDKVQLSRRKGEKDKEYILSGASLRGALRHRALRILKSQNNLNPELLIKTLFGNVVEKNKENGRMEKDEKAIKSKLIIEEAVFNDDTAFVNQTRIKIDRFTGGTITGALLDSKPITRSDRQSVKLNLTIKNYTKEEAELMLYLLKDLWTGDLAIGGEKNIGRGILLGEKADVWFDDEKIEITKGKITPTDRAKLETLLKS